MFTSIVQELQSAKRALKTRIEEFGKQIGSIEEALSILTPMAEPGVVGLVAPVARRFKLKLVKKAKVKKAMVIKDPVKVKAEKHHTMSLAARAKIGAAVKARWARVNAVKVQVAA